MHLLTWNVGIYLFVVYISIKLGSFCIWLHCRILMILHQGAFMGDALKPGKIMIFLHQWKFNKISETQIIILVIENKKIHVLQCSSIEFHGTWSAPISMTQAVPLNSMELENRMKNSQLNIFSGLPNLALFWAVRQIFLVFNIQEVWFMQIVIFDVLLMRPCVNALP